MRVQPASRFRKKKDSGCDTLNPQPVQFCASPRCARWKTARWGMSLLSNAGVCCLDEGLGVSLLRFRK